MGYSIKSQVIAFHLIYFVNHVVAEIDLSRLIAQNDVKRHPNYTHNYTQNWPIFNRG